MKRDGAVQLQMAWAKLHQSWMQKLWSQSWMESPRDQQEEQMLMTQWWLKLMKRYISKSRKLPSKLESHIYMWTCMWLIGWPIKGRIQYLRPWSVGPEASPGRWHKHWGGKGHHLRAEKVDALSKSPISLPYMDWQAGRSFMDCSPHTSLSGCYEWMSQDAGNQGQQQCCTLLQDQFWWPGMAMQMQKAISHCEWCIQHGDTCVKAPVKPIIATCPLELLHIDFMGIWDNNAAGSTTKHGEHTGFL